MLFDYSLFKRISLEVGGNTKVDGGRFAAPNNPLIKFGGSRWILSTGEKFVYIYIYVYIYTDVYIFIYIYIFGFRPPELFQIT